MAVVAWHLCSFRGCDRQCDSLVCLVAPRWCAAPCPVRLLSVLRSAFLSPWCLPTTRGLSAPALLGGCAGGVEAGREPGSLCLPLAPAEARALGALRVLPVRGPAMGFSLPGPSGFGLGLRALQWFGVGGPGQHRVFFPVQSVFRERTRPVHQGCFVWTPTPPFSGGRTPRPGPARVCVRALLGRVGQAGLPGVFRCTSPFSVAGFGGLFVCPAPSGLGLPCLLSPLGFFLFIFPCCAPASSGVPCFPARGAFGLGVLWSPLPFFCTPPCLLRSVVPSPGCREPWRSVILPSGPPLCLIFLLIFHPPLPPPLFFLLAVLLFLVFFLYFFCFFR